LCFYKQTNNILNSLLNSNDNDFIKVGLGGMAIVVGHTKRQFQIANLLEVDSKLEIRKINILQVVMFQNVLMDHKIWKEK
jgi:radical SAM superfamily enzyme with C-terminal helix-hairpin-helix motif